MKSSNMKILVTNINFNMSKCCFYRTIILNITKSVEHNALLWNADRCGLLSTREAVTFVLRLLYIYPNVSTSTFRKKISTGQETAIAGENLTWNVNFTRDWSKPPMFASGPLLDPSRRVSLSLCVRNRLFYIRFVDYVHVDYRFTLDSY